MKETSNKLIQYVKKMVLGSRVMEPEDREEFFSLIVNKTLVRTRWVLVILLVAEILLFAIHSLLQRRLVIFDPYQIATLIIVAICLLFGIIFTYLDSERLSPGTLAALCTLFWVMLMGGAWIFIHLDFQDTHSLLSYIFITLSLSVFPLFNFRTSLLFFLVNTAVTLYLALNAQVFRLLSMQILVLGLISFYTALLRYHSELATFSEKLQLQRFNKELSLLSETDQLTGLWNRRGLERNMEISLNYHRRTGKNICIYMIDIDYFKSYNDKFLHLAGDDCLRRVAQAIKGSARRSTDVAARYGGEEFIIITLDMKEEDIVKFGLLLNQAVSNLKIPFGHVPDSPYVTISVGVAVQDLETTPHRGEQQPQGDVQNENQRVLKEIIDRADKELYHAKNNGRNCVSFQGVIHQPPALPRQSHS